MIEGVEMDSWVTVLVAWADRNKTSELQSLAVKSPSFSY